MGVDRCLFICLKGWKEVGPAGKTQLWVVCHYIQHNNEEIYISNKDTQIHLNKYREELQSYWEDSPGWWDEILGPWGRFIRLNEFPL